MEIIENIVNVENIVNSLIVAAIVSLIIACFKWFLEKISSYTGEWKSVIPATDNSEEKIDRMYLIGLGNKIRGKMERISPIKENNRTWLITGYGTGDHILLAIKAKKPTQASDGSVYLVRKTDNIYQGKYLKATQNGVEKFSISIEKVEKK